MDYKANKIFHILHRLNFGWIVTYMGEEDPNGSFKDTWLDSPYIYDIYDTNDGYSMTVMTQFRYEGWNNDILTFQDWIDHIIGWIWNLRRPRGSYSNLGEEGRWRERPHGIAWAATPIRLGFGLWMDLEP